ncbi:DUF389 domain-containing protein [Faucicola mancuniensis]|uniref:DUF389 domain-containing protein n=1 Tax=Faucicola mancuniensis TaxID=1309795 RepID=UPI00397726EF
MTPKNLTSLIFKLVEQPVRWFEYFTNVINDKDNAEKSELVLTDEDIEQLQKQGLNKQTIDKIADEVNEQLSSNANVEIEPKNPSETVKSDNFSNANLAKSNLEKSSENTEYLSLNQIDKKIADEVEKQQAEQEAKRQAEQEAQYEAFKQYLAKKNSQKEVDYRQVRIDIESGALPTKMFYLLNGLAAVIAGFGLLANSPAVVIGAMLVAMLIGPISGIALAVIDARFALLKKSLGTLVSGGVLIYSVGLVLGWLFPEQSYSHEIIVRTAPNTMDVMVALAGGTAGAYAMISHNLSVAVVGVAVATALVPPLTASGILFANGEYSLAWGAFLLTLTNILAIQFTNALVLWVAGFRRLDIDESEDERVKDSKVRQVWLFLRRNAVTAVLLVGISGYLTYNFYQQIDQQRYEKSVNQIIEKGIEHQPSYVLNSSFQQEKNPYADGITPDKYYVIRVTMQGLVAPKHTQVAKMEKQIQDLTDKHFKRPPVKLQVRFVPEQVIESQPITKNDVKLDDKAINQMTDTKK